MSKKFPIFLTFKAVDNATASMKSINNKFKKQTQTVTILGNKYKRLKSELSGVTRASRRMGRSLKGVGRGMSMGITLPMLAFGASTIKTAMNFEKSMNKVKALTGAGTEDLKQLNDQAKELGSSTEYSASEVADAMGFLGMAGFKTKEIMGTIPGLLDMATASGSDLARTADIASNIMGAFAIDTTSPSAVNKVMDSLALATASSNVDLEMLSETMAKSAPVAKKYGLTLQDTTAMAGLLGNIGIQGSNAGTALNNMMLNLSAPTKAMKDQLKDLGIQTTDLNGKMRPMTSILQDMGKGMSAIPEGEQLAVLNTIFGKRAIAGAGELLTQSLKIGKDGKNAISRYSDELTNAGGKAKSMADIMRGGTSGALASLKSAFEGLQIAIADSGLLDSFTTIIKSLTRMISWMAKSSPWVIKLGVAFGVFLSVMGPLLLALGSFLVALPTILPVLIILKGVMIGMVTGALFPLMLVLGKIALVVGAVLGALWLLGKGVEVVASWFGLSIKPVDAFLTALSRVWRMIKGFGSGLMKKMGFGVTLTKDERIERSKAYFSKRNALRESAKNVLSENAKDNLTNSSKQEKIEKFEVTIKDEKGKVKDIIKVGEDKKLFSSNLGPVMGAS